MTIARAFLILNGLILALYGIYCTFNPMALAEFASFGLDNNTAIIEVRAMYGGLEFTIGLLFIICGLRRDMIATGLLVTFFVYAGLAGGRAYGLVVDGGDNGYNFAAVIYESICGLLSVILLQWLKPQLTQ